METFFERSDANQRSHRKKRFTSIKEEILENWKIRGFRIETPESKHQNRRIRIENPERFNEQTAVNSKTETLQPDSVPIKRSGIHDESKDPQ